MNLMEIVYEDGRCMELIRDFMTYGISNVEPWVLLPEG